MNIILLHNANMFRPLMWPSAGW